MSVLRTSKWQYLKTLIRPYSPVSTTFYYLSLMIQSKVHLSTLYIPSTDKDLTVIQSQTANKHTHTHTRPEPTAVVCSN